MHTVYTLRRLHRHHLLQVSDAGNASIALAYDPPRVFELQPSHGPTLGRYNVTIIGANFGAAGAGVTMLVTSNNNQAGVSVCCCGLHTIKALAC